MKAFCADVSSVGSTTSLRLKAKGTDRVLQELPIIDAKEEHRNYIISTWVRSFETIARRMVVSSGASLVHLDAAGAKAGESRLSEFHWDKSKVIVSPDDDYTIHGWFSFGVLPGGSLLDTGSSGINGLLRHCYVCPSFRGNGICRVVVEHYLGRAYRVSKPWPKTPTGHYVTWDPYQ